jgi:hypothetical protein
MISLLWIPAMALLEIIKRVVSIPIYPVAYYLRDIIRSDRRDGDMYIPANNEIAKILWLTLDDSINIEGYEDYGKDIEYCAYGKRAPIIEKMKDGPFKEFARSFHWGCLRNNCINLSRLMSPGKMSSEKIILGGKPKNFLSIRMYTGRRFRPYLQFYVWGDLRFKAGFLTNGRWELQLRSKPL